MLRRSSTRGRYRFIFFRAAFVSDRVAGEKMADTQYLKAAVVGPEYGFVLQGRADEGYLAANAAPDDGQCHRAVFPAPDPGADPVDGTTLHRLSVHGNQLITVLETCLGGRAFRPGKTIKPAGGAP